MSCHSVATLLAVPGAELTASWHGSLYSWVTNADADVSQCCSKPVRNRTTHMPQPVTTSAV
jgi:hypothetical protein